MTTNEPDKERSDLEDLDTPGKLPRELLLPEVDKPRKEIQAKVEKNLWSNPYNEGKGEVAYEAPDLKADLEALNVLNGAIVRELEAGNMDGANKLSKKRIAQEVSISKTSEAYRNNALKNYQIVSNAATADERDQLNKMNSERYKRAGGVAKEWIIRLSEGFGKGTVALTKGALFLGKSATELAGEILKTGFSVGADATVEIGKAIHILAEDKKDRGLDRPN